MIGPRPMPFGPYLAAAGWLAMMYGDVLVERLSARLGPARTEHGAAPAHRAHRRDRERQEHGRRSGSCELGVPVIDADESARAVVAPGAARARGGGRALRRGSADRRTANSTGAPCAI